MSDKPIDPDLLRSIDEEFAELEREIARLKEAPRKAGGPGDPTGIITALQALYAEWETRAAERPDRPVWQKRLDDIFQRTVQAVIENGQTIDATGNLGFRLDKAALQSALPAATDEARAALEKSFIEKWTQKDKPKTVEASDLAGILAALMTGKTKKRT